MLFFLRLSSILNKSTPIWNHICLVRSENRQSSGVWCDPSKLVLNCSMFMALQLIIDSQIDICCRLISRWINFFIEGKREKEDKEEAARDPDKLQETSQTDTVHSSGWQKTSKFNPILAMTIFHQSRPTINIIIVLHTSVLFSSSLL